MEHEFRMKELEMIGVTSLRGDSGTTGERTVERGDGPRWGKHSRDAQSAMGKILFKVSDERTLGTVTLQGIVGIAVTVPLMTVCEVSRVRVMLLMSVAYNFFCLLLGLLFCCLSIYC